MNRRIFGLETEFGVALAAAPTAASIAVPSAAMTPDEIVRRLFRPLVVEGRSTNTFLTNGSRLYLDVGSHPEYATAECDSLAQLIAHDKAGELILAEMVTAANLQLAEEGIGGQIHVFKNNTDSAGSSFGCHENYSLRRGGDFNQLVEALVPHLVTRQILTGAGKVLVTPRGASFRLSQRAEHLFDPVSNSTTRNRPLVNSRDEPHADPALFRRLHVISGDSSLAEPTVLLKVGAMDLVLRLLESGRGSPASELAAPMQAIRDVSCDITGQAPIALAKGGVTNALAVQRRYLDAVLARPDLLTPDDDIVCELWGRGLDGIESGNLAAVERDLDWVIKWRLIERYLERNGVGLDDPRVSRLDLAYADISPGAGLLARLTARGLVNRVVTDAEIADAVKYPPTTTRANLRGRFVAAARAARKDYSVDWIHLKLHHPEVTLTCPDPFVADDSRVDALIESLVQ